MTLFVATQLSIWMVSLLLEMLFVLPLDFHVSNEKNPGCLGLRRRLCPRVWFACARVASLKLKNMGSRRTIGC